MLSLSTKIEFYSYSQNTGLKTFQKLENQGHEIRGLLQKKKECFFCDRLFVTRDSVLWFFGLKFPFFLAEPYPFAVIVKRLLALSKN